jgi:SprT-like protein
MKLKKDSRKVENHNNDELENVLTQCYREFERVNENFFDSKLPTPHIELNHRFTARAGAFYPRTKKIALSWKYYLAWGLKELLGVLRHEIGHLALPKESHSPKFKALLKKLRAPRYSKPLVTRPFKYEWACPNCGIKHWTRKQVMLACGRCCDRYNAGRFERDFQLRLVRKLRPRRPAAKMERAPR